jgi:hypothetical protein
MLRPTSSGLFDGADCRERKLLLDKKEELPQRIFVKCEAPKKHFISQYKFTHFGW